MLGLRATSKILADIFAARVNSPAQTLVSEGRMEHVLSMPQVESCEARISELDDIDALVVRYRAQVLRLMAFSLDDPDEAASVTQDCFLRAYDTRAQYRGQCAVST